MEVQIIQWYVEEGAHIEEWKPLCQYQSDKAVDDVGTSFAFRMSTAANSLDRSRRGMKGWSKSFISKQTTLFQPAR